ncbi:MAG: DUF5683 domain-containing protein [Flavobacterium sp.]|nr:DUF5683 domain-containing protein [Flavobacterium sp.]
MKQYIAILFFLCATISAFAQSAKNGLVIKSDTVKVKAINPLAPAKAAFYSAILPGLGQAYNKKYWKIPIVYAAMGTSMYFYLDNNKKYHRYRDAYKMRLAGQKDEFYGEYSDQVLINAQRTFQRNRDISFLLTVGFYVLNIVEANVSAHLLQFNVNENLSVAPDIYQNEINYKQNIGLTLNYKF